MSFRPDCRSAAILPCLTMLLSLLSLPAVAQTRLAYSQRLGIEVVADRPDWCGPAPVLRVIGPDTTVFVRPDFAALLQRIGTDLIAPQCPAAKGVTFAGYLPGATAAVWGGSANPADEWALHVARVEVLAPLPPAPLLGEWTGTTGCRNDLRAVVLSIAAVDGSAASGVMEITPQRATPGGTTRYAVAGSFDLRSGQFALRPGTVLRPGNETPRSVVGTVGGGELRMNNECGGGTDLLAHRDGPAALAARVAEDAGRRVDWLAQAAATPRPKRLVGVLHAVPVRQPSCAELLAWAASAPVNLRLRVLGQGQGILRQFDDVNSARVFGDPAYHWFSTDDDGRRVQAVELNQVIQAACPLMTSQQDPRYALLRQVANDGAGINELAVREHTDVLVDRLPIMLATAGGPLREMYDDLGQLIRDPARLFGNRMRWSEGYLTDDDRSQLVAEATRLRQVLADRAAQQAAAAVAAEPASEAGLRGILGIAARFKSDFAGDTAGLQPAVDARTREIVGQLTTDTVAFVQDAPRTLDGLATAQARVERLQEFAVAGSPDSTASLAAAMAALRNGVGEASAATAASAIAAATPTVAALAEQRRQVANLHQMLGDALPGGGAALDAALTELDRRTGEAAAQRTVAAIAALPPTADGLRQARTLRVSVPSVAADAAVTALAAATAPDVIQDAAARLAAVSDSVDGLRAATALREEVAGVLRPEAAEAADRFAAAVSDRIAAIGTDSTTQLATELAVLDASWESVARARILAAEAARPFAGTEQAKALTEAGQQQVESTLDTLADKAIAGMAGVNAASFVELVAALSDTSAAVRRFAVDPAGRSAADRVRAAADARVDMLTASVFPNFRAALETAPPSVMAARKLAQLWADMARSPLATRAPFHPYVDLVATEAVRLLAGACQPAAGGFGLSAKDAIRPLVIGTRVGTLGALLCDLSDLGVIHAELRPGEDGTLRLALFLPLGRLGDLTEGPLQADANWPVPDKLEDLLDLRPPSAPPVGDAMLDVAVFVLREVDVAVGHQALIPVRLGDQSATQAIAVAEWRRRSAGLSPVGAGSVSAPQVCAQLRTAAVGQMQPSIAARALLACPAS